MRTHDLRRCEPIADPLEDGWKALHVTCTCVHVLLPGDFVLLPDYPLGVRYRIMRVDAVRSATVRFAPRTWREVQMREHADGARVNGGAA